VANPYRAVFAAPGTLAFSMAGLVARMPMSMLAIGIVTMLGQLRGAYWLAGAVAATFALSSALIAPQVSRLVDRLGQARVLRPATCLSALGMLLLLLAVRLDLPGWTLFPCAVLAGCMPSIPAMVRARWSWLYRGTPMLHTAFALESVLDEICFIIGPILSVSLSVLVFPEAGPLAAAFLLLVGTLLLAAQRRTEPPVLPVAAGPRRPVIGRPAVLILVTTMAAVGMIFGSIDVTTIAFAGLLGQPVAASWALSICAVGSGLAGITFGALRLSLPPRQLLAAAIAFMLLTVLPLPVAGSIPLLAAILFVVGMSVSPTIILTMNLVERIVPPAELTEGMTWAMTGLGIGVAIGSAAAGWTVDVHGTAAAFGLAGFAAALALLVVLSGQNRLKDSDRVPPLPPSGAELATCR